MQFPKKEEESRNYLKFSGVENAIYVLFISSSPNLFLGELSFGGRWALKLTKDPYNSSN